MDDQLRHDEPARDPMLAAALRDAAGGPPDGGGAVDWEHLRATIAARAASRLARRQRGPAWWEYAAAWSRTAVPVLLAASVIMAAALTAPELSAPDLDTPSLGEAADAPTARVVIEPAMIDELPADSVMAALVAASDDGWLFQGVVDDE